MLDTLRGLVIAHTNISLPLIIWLMTLFFREIPQEYEEASMLDGAGRITIFFRIMLPLSIHGIVTIIIMGFLFSWNDLLFALVLTSHRARTLPMGLTEFVTAIRGMEWGQMYGSIVFLVAPVLVLVFALQKYLLRGFLMFVGRTEVS